MPVKRKTRVTASEHQEQAALIEFAQMRARVVPEWNCLFAVPNGGFRNKRTAALLKEEGVKSGVSDLILLVARKGYHGMVLEMKAQNGRLSDAQRDWLKAIGLQGYLPSVAYGWMEGARLLAEYLADNEALEMLARIA